MNRAKVLRALRTASRLEGVDIELSLLKPDQYAISYFGHAEFGGAEVWISWIESTVPGRGFEAMRRLCQAADDHDVVLRLSPEDHGSGKLIALYERLGFERDPAGGENMERVPQPSRERALRQWLDKSVVTASSVPGDAPRVVYRGTAPGTAPLNVVTRGSFGAGFYFAGDEAQAAQYAGNRGEVLPYHLNLKNPYLFSIREPQVVDSWGEGLVQDIFEPGSADRLIEQALHDPQGGFGPEIEERLRELGHDGVVATYPDGTQEFVAFRQTQVRPAREHVLPEREVVRSEALAHWFEGSQVVGGDGAPLVLYHGTTADVTKFDLSYAGSDGIRYALPAIFATTDARLASDYALNKFSREIADAMRALQQYKNLHPGEYGPEYEERYEAVKAAFRAAGHGVQHGEGANVMPVYMALKNPLRIDACGRRAMEILPEAIPKAASEGFDGLIVANLVDNASDTNHQPADVYIAMRASQVKSAIGNRGTFSSHSDDIRYSFAGPKSATAPLDRLSQARDMLQEGVDAEQVRRATGWSLGLDGQPRYEICDQLAFLKGTGNFGDIVHKRRAALQTEGPTYLSDILYHPELFDAYPSLREMEVQFIPQGVRADARVGGDVFIEVRETLRSEDALSKILHEIQHLIQTVEGFAPGGSPDDAFADPRMRPGATLSGLQAAHRIYQSMLVEMIRPQTLEQFAKDAWGSTQVTQEIQNDYSRYLLDHQKASLSPAISADVQRRAAVQWYRRLAGEIEARNVQARQHFSRQERVLIPPMTTADMPAENAILLSSAGEGFRADEGLAPPVKVYHGTSQAFEAFSPNERGIFFAEERRRAQSFVGVKRGDSPRVIEAELDIKRPWTYVYYGLDFPCKDMLDQSPQALQAQGYDGVYMPNEQVWIAFEPEQIRITNVYPVEGSKPVQPKPRCAEVGSDGQKLHSTPQGVENFWRWFGDSKILDEQGRPLVLHHGTGRGGAYQFQRAHWKTAYGHFFTDDKSAADFYTLGPEPQTYNVYLKAANPLRLDKITEGEVAMPQALRAWVNEIFDPEIADPVEQFNDWLGTADLYSRDLGSTQNELMGWAEEKGYDAVVFYDTKGGGGVARSFVVFESSQIKSASENNGDFDAENSDIRFSFAGGKSQAADLLRLGSAQARSAVGEDAEVVRQETGWFRGVDGQWRYEISDTGAKFVEQSYLAEKGKWYPSRFIADAKDYGSCGEGLLGDVIDHPALSEAYPELKNIRVEGRIRRGVEGGSYDGKTIIAQAPTVDRLLSVLLHEIQHGLQNIEGFANGGSPLGFYDPEKSAAAIAYMQGLHEQNPDVGWDQGVERRRREDARKIPLQAGATEADKFEAYRRLAGEVEARNTQARQGMTDAERRLRPPSTTADVPDQDLIQITGGVVIGDVVLQAVYHGTPHHFDRFSINKIGTGEGSQVCTKLRQT